MGRKISLDKMWRLLRGGSGDREGDADNAESLERYFSVMRDDLPAKFRICKKIPVDVDFGSEVDELWGAHQTALKGFRDLVEEVDEGKTELTDVGEPENSLLDLKVELAERVLESCHFCERRCGVDRAEGETGACGVGEPPRIASEFLHHGEEPELVPSYTIFFSGCTFNCQFCQNWDISQSPGSGVKTSPQEISSSISTRRREGARNVNWVGGDPTPNLHNVLRSLDRTEVNIPSVWNSNMYLTEDGMRLLSGTQDVYLTDFKYGDDDCASRYSKVEDYWEVVTRNHGLAFQDSELIIRHLVLPGHLDCCTKVIMEWVEEELSPDVRFNLMGQYRPAGRARDYPELSRRVSGDEMGRASKLAEEIGLRNVIG